jgi:hypothetical protein
MTPISITIASPPDRDDLVAELWLGKDLLGEVTRDAEDGFRVELYPAPGKTPWSLRVADLTAALKQAAQRLGTS